MTFSEVQTELDDSACINCLTDHQLRIIQTLLLWQQLNGSVPMTKDDIDTVLEEGACLACLTDHQLLIAQTELEWEILQGGGGGGAVAASGTNFCFTGASPNQVLKIKNIDTGLANRIDSYGADGDQSISLDDGSAC